GGGDVVMYEAYVEGHEFTVGILGEEALPVVEIEPVGELFDFESKYEPGMAVETVPARIPDELAGALQAEALRVHRLLRMEHFSRVDFMMDADGGVWCLEANALPGLTGNSLFPKAARAAGLEFAELCERICLTGCG
ncbi:MAG: D-alanine--D-alanine ligase, partial [Gemmatimonadetes bacterium]|nr:D-alanine--D-alanine ligase [Gemmatimonadota bacterium]